MMNFYKAAQSKTWIKFFDEAATGQHERSKTAVFVLYVPQAGACWKGSENEMWNHNGVVDWISLHLNLTK